MKVEAPRYDSIAVSCHKFFGFPSPAGLFIMRRSLYDEFNASFSKIHNPEYINHVPGTITCSRDAVKPAEFSYFTWPSAVARQTEDAKLMLENTSFLLTQLRTHLPELSATRVNPLSNTVFFRCPADRIVKKYSLATMHLEIDGIRENHAHVVVMPHVRRRVLADSSTTCEGVDAVARRQSEEHLGAGGAVRSYACRRAHATSSGGGRWEMSP